MLRFAPTRHQAAQECEKQPQAHKGKGEGGQEGHPHDQGLHEHGDALGKAHVVVGGMLGVVAQDPLGQLQGQPAKTEAGERAAQKAEGPLTAPTAAGFRNGFSDTAAVGGAAVGGATGGIIGALVGMGIPEYEAKRYDGKIRGGNILISVHTDDSERQDVVEEIYERAGAEDIKSTSEASVPA